MNVSGLLTSFLWGLKQHEQRFHFPKRERKVLPCSCICHVFKGPLAILIQVWGCSFLRAHEVIPSWGLRWFYSTDEWVMKSGKCTLYTLHKAGFDKFTLMNNSWWSKESCLWNSRTRKCSHQGCLHRRHSDSVGDILLARLRWHSDKGTREYMGSS